MNKIDRVYSYVKPETRIKHAISILRTIKNHPLIYNKEIPQILEQERKKRMEEPYKILKKLETKLREYIKTKLKMVSENWWEERIPSKIRKKAEQRKEKDEKQYPWHKGEDLHPIHYVDFTDYVKIITDKENWEQVFKEKFKDEKVISVKLSELEPIRNAIAHSREVSKKDLVKLQVYYDEIIS